MRSHPEFYVAAATVAGFAAGAETAGRFGLTAGVAAGVAVGAVAWLVLPLVLAALLVTLLPLRAVGDDGVELRGLAAKRRLLRDLVRRDTPGETTIS